MYKSDEEVERILNHSLNITRVTSIGINRDKVGLREGEKVRDFIPIEEKVQIGTLARLIGSIPTGELIGLPRAQVNRYKNGKDSSNHPNKEIESGIVDNLAPIRDKAIANVDFLLDVVNEKASKMSGSKAASAAKNLVEVYDKLGPKVGSVNFNTPQIVFYAPRVLESRDYPTQEVEAING